MNLDEQLLAQKQESDETARRVGGLREAQRTGSGSVRAGEAAGFQGGAPVSLRQAVIAAKRKED